MFLYYLCEGGRVERISLQVDKFMIVLNLLSIAEGLSAYAIMFCLNKKANKNLQTAQDLCYR